VVVANPNAAPVEAPREVKPEPPPQSFTAAVGGVAGGIPGGVPGGIVGGIPPPPPPPPAAPVRVGGDIKEPRKIHDVKPIYPQIAMTAKVQGVVIIEATIGKDGSVTNAKILRSQPLLDQAALDAVKQWKFTPTLLNGVPVEVIMTVTVNFTLQ
jgi:protein TonB